MRNFRELKVYQKSLDLAEEVYRFKDQLPKTEEFGLKDQFRRSVTSISINISEGSAKATNKHFKTYLEHSLGSSYEVETLMNLSKRLYQLENKEIVLANIEIQKMLVALIRSLEL